MKGRKPNLTVIPASLAPSAATTSARSAKQDSRFRAPAWLPKDAKTEWAVATADLASRGLLFRGAMGTLASYCVCIAAIKQRQAVLDRDPGDRESFQDQIKAISQAKQLAVELGLTVTSRTRAFPGKSANERDWDDLEVG